MRSVLCEELCAKSSSYQTACKNYPRDLLKLKVQAKVPQVVPVGQGLRTGRPKILNFNLSLSEDSFINYTRRPLSITLQVWKNLEV